MLKIAAVVFAVVALTAPARAQEAVVSCPSPGFGRYLPASQCAGLLHIFRGMKIHSGVAGIPWCRREMSQIGVATDNQIEGFCGRMYAIVDRNLSLCRARGISADACGWMD